MKHKALIGFDINEYPEIEIFQKYFECDFCEYSEDYFYKNISKYSILVPHLYLKLTNELINKASNLKYIFTPSTGTNHLDLKAINNNDIEFDTNFDVPPPIATIQACTLTVLHIMYNDGAGTTEANDCSNRGVCIEKTGECECFKGFYGEDCSRAIAFAL